MCCALHQLRIRRLMDLGLNSSEILPKSPPANEFPLLSLVGCSCMVGPGDSSVRMYPAEGLLL